MKYFMQSAPTAFLAGLRLALAALLWAVLSPAGAQPTGRDFDHVKTGFPLSGAHAAQRCESCHLNGVFKGTPRDCASCHLQGARLAKSNIVKPAQHIPTQQACDTCHGTQSFAGAKFSHAGVQAGSCQTCHGGAMAPGKPAGHLLTQASCDTCHRTAAWLPASRFNHVGVTAGTCASCHGSTATGKPPTHIPTTVPTAMPSCDSCHKSGFTAFRPARLHSSVAVSAGCATCHTGGFPPAVGKPNTPVHAGVTVCETCHKSTSTWAGAKVDHSTFTVATNCASCHNGSTATGKAGNHIPVGATNCFACHVTASWRPSKWNHTQVAVAAQCSSCHSGAFPPADGRPATHIPYAALTGVAIANCDTCHAGTTVWTGARLHSKLTLANQCANCHTGNYSPGSRKPNNATHVGVTTCEGCHKSTASWTSGVTFAHSPANAVGTGTCDSCHNGTTAKGKTATHVPLTGGTAKCDSCHRSQASFATAVTMNHAVVTASECKSCHNGAFVTQGITGALAKPANHIPEAQLLNGAAMDCKACHIGTTVWTAQRMNHNGSLGGGAGWCKACHATGTAFLGTMQKNSLTHQRKTPLQIDCSESGCHRPLGAKGTSFVAW